MEWKTLNKEDDWIECVSCRNWLYKFCSPHND